MCLRKVVKELIDASISKMDFAKKLKVFIHKKWKDLGIEKEPELQTLKGGNGKVLATNIYKKARDGASLHELVKLLTKKYSARRLFTFKVGKVYFKNIRDLYCLVQGKMHESNLLGYERFRDRILSYADEVAKQGNKECVINISIRKAVLFATPMPNQGSKNAKKNSIKIVRNKRSWKFKNSARAFDFLKDNAPKYLELVSLRTFSRNVSALNRLEVSWDEAIELVSIKERGISFEDYLERVFSYCDKFGVKLKRSKKQSYYHFKETGEIGFECKEHGTYLKSLDKLDQGCVSCSELVRRKLRRLKWNDVVTLFEGFGFSVVSQEEEYVNNRTKLDICCSNGHMQKMSVEQLRRGKACLFKSKGLAETLVYQVASKVFDVEFLTNRSVIAPLEIDIFSEQLSLGIEFDGEQHIRKIAKHDDIESQILRDRQTDSRSAELGIKLIRVPHTLVSIIYSNFDDSILKKDIENLYDFFKYYSDLKLQITKKELVSNKNYEEIKKKTYACKCGNL